MKIHAGHEYVWVADKFSPPKLRLKKEVERDKRWRSKSAIHAKEIYEFPSERAALEFEIERRQQEVTRAKKSLKSAEVSLRKFQTRLKAMAEIEARG